ncbi:MAG: histidinol-phosphatase HisJ [Candidatus Hermodarchaeota archaeon]
MKLEDWHTHSEICHHAIGSIEDYVKKAIDLKLTTIGISDHFPYEFLKNIERIPYQEYAISLDEIEHYLSTVENLRDTYNPKINIKLAFEIDYFENQEASLNIHLDKIIDRLDYIIGSIHILNFKDERGAWGFDDSRFRKDYQYYGPDKVYMEYYKTQQKMLNSDKFRFDIVAHFDLPKKFNNVPENKEVIMNEVLKILEIIKKKDKVMEINTGGLRKEVKQQYPSEEIIRIMHDLDIPVLLGSDAHAPQEVAWKFKNIVKMLKEIGYNQIACFSKRKRTFIEL